MCKMKVISIAAKKLTFEDVGLIPRFNRITSRTHTNIYTWLGRTQYKTPFIPANMDTVIGPKMAAVCDARGAPVIFHRFAPLAEQIEWVHTFPGAYASIGMDDNGALQQLYDAGCRRFCIDIAHGHSQMMLDKIAEIRRLDGAVEIIAGNVCTGQAVRDLAAAGADIIKVGVGPGAACITRMMTGVGVPQFSAIVECVAAARQYTAETTPSNEGVTTVLHSQHSTGRQVHIIADGGIKHPRDAVLAIAAGANAVMMGSVFARTMESAAPKEERNGVVYGRYRGQASAEFMEDYFGDGKKRHAEGVAFDVPIKKSVEDVFAEYEGGLRSALTYEGAENLHVFQDVAEFFEATANYMNESNSRMQ